MSLKWDVSCFYKYLKLKENVNKNLTLRPCVEMIVAVVFSREMSFVIQFGHKICFFPSDYSVI